jgi:hypothetical protein
MATMSIGTSKGVSANRTQNNLGFYAEMGKLSVDFLKSRDERRPTLNDLTLVLILVYT